MSISEHIFKVLVLVGLTFDTSPVGKLSYIIES